MVDVKTEGKERETDDLKAKLEEEGKLLTSVHLQVSYVHESLTFSSVFI